MSLSTASSVGYDELAVLKFLALDGGLTEEIKTSCTELADTLDASNQTASRRLHRLERAGYLERETVSDGQWVSITPDGERALQAEYEEYRQIFESDATIELAGRVTDGMGEGRHYISLAGYKRQFVERLEYEPFPGTLNVELVDDSDRRARGLTALESIPIDGWEDGERTYGPAICYPAVLETPAGQSYEGAHVITPERTHHDEDKLELIAPEKLRDVLDLEDDDYLSITVGER